MNKENINTSRENAKHQCSINIDINGFTLSLSAHSHPPKAEDLFHAMFFDEELKKAPTHYRQQRWNKRRIQKRWNWKRGREREIYEKRAEYLKNKWIEMKKDFKSNNNTFLSKEFLDKNRNLKLNLNDNADNNNNNNNNNNTDVDNDNDKSTTNSPSESEENDDENDGHIKKQDKISKVVEFKRNKILSKIEGKRKHIRRREKLIERIANGETFENFVDHQKFNNIYNKKDNLLFGGNNYTKKTKTKKSKKNKTKSMKLADFVEAAKQLSNPKKINNYNNNNKINKEYNKNNNNNKGTKCKNENIINVSLDAIQAQQTKDFKALTRKKRDEIHSMAMLQNNNDYSSKLFPNKIRKNKENEENTTNNNHENFEINPLLNHSMHILNYDHMTYRKKIISEIYCGSSVFSCIPCCIEPSNTLLIEAIFIEKLLLNGPSHSSLSKLSGLFELKKRLKKQFINKTIEILPIFERSYIHRQCQQLLLIQFQDDNNLGCGDSILSLYHCWKQQISNMNQSNNKNNKNNKNCSQLRIEFIEPWFSKSYFLQHSHLWSDIALNSMITVYDNNNKYIQNVNKTARHCKCSFKRIVYFPPFNPKYSHAPHPKHDMNCICNCCCCIFYHDNYNNNNNNMQLRNGDIVLWHGRKCIADSKVNHSNQDYRIQIDEFVGKYVVALSSLQIVKKYKNLQNNQMLKVTNLNHLNNSIFDSQKHIWDDLSFVLYVKQFWNISNIN